MWRLLSPHRWASWSCQGPILVVHSRVHRPQTGIAETRSCGDRCPIPRQTRHIGVKTHSTVPLRLPHRPGAGPMLALGMRKLFRVGRLDEIERVVVTQERDRYFLWFLSNREATARHDVLDVYGRHARLNG